MKIISRVFLTERDIGNSRAEEEEHPVKYFSAHTPRRWHSRLKSFEPTREPLDPIFIHQYSTLHLEVSFPFPELFAKLCCSKLYIYIQMRYKSMEILAKGKIKKKKRSKVGICFARCSIPSLDITEGENKRDANDTYINQVSNGFRGYCAAWTMKSPLPRERSVETRRDSAVDIPVCQEIPQNVSSLIERSIHRWLARGREESIDGTYLLNYFIFRNT